MKQPIVCNDSAGADNLIADLCVQVVGEPQTLISEFLILMPSLDVLTAPMIFWVLQRLRSANICRLVKIMVEHSLLCGWSDWF